MISQTLKEKTKSLHDKLEQQFQSAKIFDKTYTLDNYRKLIHFNYLFLLNFESDVFKALSKETAQNLHLEKRRKLPLIEKDLSSLNIEKSEPENLPEIVNEAEAFGVLYVMEGSTLGGNVIAKQLAKSPEFQNISFHYFNCYGEDTGVLWKNFKESLDENISEHQYDDVLRGAMRAFEFLLGLF